jgi:hypothetical protein
MEAYNMIKRFVFAAIAALGLTAGAAQAGGVDWSVNIGFGVPGVIVPPPPVVVAPPPPPPVIYRPAPVVYHAPVVYPAPYYVVKHPRHIKKWHKRPHHYHHPHGAYVHGRPVVYGY